MSWITIGIGAVAVLIALIGWASVFKTFRVSPWEQAALFIDGGFDRLLPPGRYRIFSWRRQLNLVRVNSAGNYLSIGPVDAVTADALPVRLNATAVYQIVDVERSFQEAIDPMIQLAVSRALLKLAAAERLDALMARAEPYDDRLLAEINLPSAVIEITQAALGAVVLPPELRRMLTEVERARLEGLAALERARGEQAALRSLANAARMLKDNPELMNLRLLQAVGSGSKGATLVLGEGALRSVSNGNTAG